MKIAKNMEYIFLFATVVGLNIVAIIPNEHTYIQVSAPVVAMATTTAQG
jgi:hypothetical protein